MWPDLIGVSTNLEHTKLPKYPTNVYSTAASNVLDVANESFVSPRRVGKRISLCVLFCAALSNISIPSTPCFIKPDFSGFTGSFSLDIARPHEMRDMPPKWRENYIQRPQVDYISCLIMKSAATLTSSTLISFFFCKGPQECLGE